MKRFYILFACLIVVLGACKKDEGYGGLATITGKVYAKNYNSNGKLVSENYLGGVKVYISEHGNSREIDHIETGYDGTYTFEFLQKGSYDVWVFGDCDSCSWGQYYEIRNVNVGSAKEKVTVPDMIISI